MIAIMTASRVLNGKTQNVSVSVKNVSVNVVNQLDPFIDYFVKIKPASATSTTFQMKELSALPSSSTSGSVSYPVRAMVTATIADSNRLTPEVIMFTAELTSVLPSNPISADTVLNDINTAFKAVQPATLGVNKLDITNDAVFVDSIAVNLI